MWTCVNCRESLDDQFDRCWKCGTSRAGAPEPAGLASASPDTGLSGQVNPLSCARCSQRLDYVGRKRFHEGRNWGVFGEIGELFVKREHFDVYVCPRCGRVEFFVDGIGEQFRPQA